MGHDGFLRYVSSSASPAAELCRSAIKASRTFSLASEQLCIAAKKLFVVIVFRMFIGVLVVDKLSFSIKFSILAASLGIFFFGAALLTVLWLPSKDDRLSNLSSMATTVGAFVAIIALFVAGLGGVFTAMQLSLSRAAARHHHAVAIVQRVVEHNARIATNPAMQKAVAAMQGLKVPSDEVQANDYWSVRMLHLSHLALLLQVWELGGAGDALPREMDGWSKFGRLFVTHLATETLNSGATAQAAKDVWSAMYAQGAYETLPTGFKSWLKNLGGPHVMAVADAAQVAKPSGVTPGPDKDRSDPAP